MRPHFNRLAEGMLRIRTLALLIGGGILALGFILYRSVHHTESTTLPDPRVVNALIALIGVLLAALAGVTLRRGVRVWRAVRSGSAGSRLQTRVILVFSLVTIIPTLMIAVFAVVFLDRGIQAWFDQRVVVALEESVAVARSYLNEHQETLRADALAMARDLDRDSYLLTSYPARFQQVVIGQAHIRLLTDAVVMQGTRILAMTPLSFSFAFEQLSPDMLARAKAGEVVMLGSEDDGKVIALTSLSSIPDGYLIIGRFVDSKVLGHMDSANGAVAEYHRLKAMLKSIQIQFSAIFLGVALLLLLAAVWYGMVFAGRLVLPISKLAAANERVRAGDYTARVEARGTDEIAGLSRAFNRMAEQLETQRRSLIDANRQLDARRRFSEAVLAGVSAGVVALDGQRTVTLVNRSACQLLGWHDDDWRGKPCVTMIPEIHDLLDAAAADAAHTASDTLRIVRDETTRTLHVRITGEEVDGTIDGFVVTFDDMTELTKAQRAAAWADVARRIAHEIKNPLTPIQLAAERLKRKYGKQLPDEEGEAFSRYTDTIVRHVGDIGKMVEEFVSFARMPAPSFAMEDLCDLVRRAVFSEEGARGDIHYLTELPDHTVMLRADARQMQQALSNLLKNAAEALEAAKEAGCSFTPEITVRLAEETGKIVLIILDNGPGFPADLIDRLTEPYVTTRTKGTGLGLAIVRKIIDDHGGTLALENRDKGGARIVMRFTKE